MDNTIDLIAVLASLSTKGEIDSVQISWKKYETEYDTQSYGTSMGGYTTPVISKLKNEQLRPDIYIKYK